MKIYLLTTKLNFKTGGGSVTDLHLKAKGLTELGHEVAVITTRSAANTIDQALAYKVYQENIEAKNYIKLQREAYKIIKRYAAKADVIYIDGNNFLYGAGFYKLFGGQAPIVCFFNMKLNCWQDPEGSYHKEGFFARRKRKFRFLLEHRLGVPPVNRLEAFVYNTPRLAQVYYKFGHLKAKGFIVEDMVDTEDIIKREGITFEAIIHRQTQNEKITLYCSGRMLPEKGFDLIIKAFRLLKDKDKYQVIMGGSGSDEIRLKNMVKDERLEKYFSFPGWLSKEKMYKNLSQAQVFIFPRWWLEYGSVVLTEAMALGLPCVVPAGGALAWLSQGGSLPFEPDNYKELAKRIEELGSSADLRIKLAKGGLIRAKELDYKKLVIKLEKAMKFAVNNKIV